MRLATLFFLAAVAASAQLDNDTITVAVESEYLPQAARISIGVCVAAELGKGFDEVLGVIQGVGLSERNLVSADVWGGGACPDPGSSGQPFVYWSFSDSRPIAKLKETIASLSRLSAAAPPGFSVGHRIDSSRSENASECPVPTLVSQARRHADAVSGAAGLRVGAVLALSDGTSIENAEPSLVLYEMGIPGSGGPPGPSVIAVVPGCTITVKFKLLR
jgi:hypothetical protein